MKRILAVFAFLLLARFYGLWADDVLLQKENLVYEGAFRVPAGHLGTGGYQYDTLGYGGYGIGYNPTNNSLIIKCHAYSQQIVEISIPEIRDSSVISELATASLIQQAYDVTEGHSKELGLNHEVINDGSVATFLPYNGMLLGAAYSYFDAGYVAYRSHFYASLNWMSESSNFHGMYILGTDEHANGGYVGGYMCIVPGTWRNKLGGPVLTGLCGVPIITRTSWGPTAWVFDPDDMISMDVDTVIPAKCLVGYDSTHPTLGVYPGPSLKFNSVTTVRGIVFPENTKSILFFGKHGLGRTGQGDTCYGIGTNNLEWHDQDIDGHHYCYDPVNSAKGNHGYPYVYYVWAYNAEDLEKVAQGEINPDTGEPYQPWEIEPYAIWQLDLPDYDDPGTRSIAGAAYDPSTQRIFVSHYGADRSGYDPYPIIHVYKVSLETSFDINQDGSVNIQDVQLVVNVILGNATNNRADVNGDGSVNISDVQAVVNEIIGR